MIISMKFITETAINVDDFSINILPRAYNQETKSINGKFIVGARHINPRSSRASYYSRTALLRERDITLIILTLINWWKGGVPHTSELCTWSGGNSSRGEYGCQFNEETRNKLKFIFKFPATVIFQYSWKNRFGSMNPLVYQHKLRKLPRFANAMIIDTTLYRVIKFLFK